MSNSPSFEGIIYKLFCYDSEVLACYVGSTKNIKTRLKDHRSNTNCKSRKEHNSILYETIRQSGGWDNWSYQVLATMRVNNYHELHKFEALYIKSTKNTLNINIPTRTRKQYYEDEKKNILAYKKSYHQNNRVKILAKRRATYEENKEQHRIKQKAYYTLNKEKISEKRKLKRYWLDGTTTCIGSSIKRHLKSNIHKQSMKIFTKKLHDHLALRFPYLKNVD